MGRNYFFGKHRENNDLPMQGVFIISNEIENKDLLHSLIKKIKSSKGIKRVTLGGCIFEKANETVIISKE